MPTLQLGAVSYAGARTANVEVRRHATSFVVATRFGLLVRGDPSQFQRAMVSASVNAGSPYLVSLDGERLGPTPQIVMASAAVGTVSQHRLEIEVPNSLTEKSAVAPSVIQLEVVPE